MYRDSAAPSELCPAEPPRWYVQYRRGRYLVIADGVQVAACSDLLTAEGLAAALQQAAALAVVDNAPGSAREVLVMRAAMEAADASLFEALERADVLASQVPEWAESSPLGPILQLVWSPQ